MKNIKAKNGYYINNFSSISEEMSWNALTNFIKENSEKFNSISIKPNEKKVIVSCKDESKILNFIKQFEKTKLYEVSLIRTIKLNVEFDENIGDLILSNKNIEKFNDYNEIFYTITIDDSVENTLYFHETSLISNENENENVVLVLLNFDEVKENKMLNKSIFLCYNNDEKKFIENQYLNVDNSLFDVNMFIKLYNNYEINDMNIFKNYLNFKISKSNFVLSNGIIDDFLNFKEIINEFIYESFIKSLYNFLKDFKGEIL